MVSQAIQSFAQDIENGWSTKILSNPLIRTDYVIEEEEPSPSPDAPPTEEEDDDKVQYFPVSSLSKGKRNCFFFVYLSHQTLQMFLSRTRKPECCTLPFTMSEWPNFVWSTSNKLATPPCESMISTSIRLGHPISNPAIWSNKLSFIGISLFAFRFMDI